MRETEIWSSGSADTTPSRTGSALWLSGKGLTPAEAPASPSVTESVMLLPTKPYREACGVVLVPDAFSSRILLNGVRIRPGLHVLRHSDRIAVDERDVWFAVAASPDELPYDPELHGDPVFCHRTKARLKSGDAMVICRGTPEADCGMMFTASAWSVGAACHSCGALPGDPGWSPPVEETRDSLVELLGVLGGARSS